MKVDMRKNPARGIYSQIAREEGINRVTVKEAIEKHRNPRLCARFVEILEERKAELKRYDRAVKGGA